MIKDRIQKNDHKYKNKKIVLGLFFSLLINFILLGYVITQDISSKNSLKNKYNLLDPAVGLIEKKDLIVNIQPLRDQLNEYEKDKNISIYFEFLNTGANVSINKNEEFWPASLLKLPVVMAATEKIEKGEWKWKNELVIMSSDKNDKFGTMYQKPVGTKVTIEELVKKALIESDNTANFVLVRNLEPKEFQDIYEHIGLKEFISSEGKIGAKKYSVFFRSLYNATYLKEVHSERLLKYMTETPFNEYLASGLPEKVNFSHKIGVSDEKDVYLDSGIVYLPNRPYILTVMINTKDIEFAKKQMKDISQKVYSYISNFKEENEE